MINEHGAGNGASTNSNKRMGFRRNIYLAWMDAAAAISAETDDLAEARARLEAVVGKQIGGTEAKQLAVQVLTAIWFKSRADYPSLYPAAQTLYARSSGPDDRLWLHYGMSALVYDFFRRAVAVIGQLSRNQETFAPADVKKRLLAELGQFGALETATARILFSLRDWGVLAQTEPRLYAPRRRCFPASNKAFEEWMLAVVLTANEGEEIAFPDLMRLPELFPFQFRITVDEVRVSPWFAVQRQGLGWDMVRLARSPDRR